MQPMGAFRTMQPIGAYKTMQQMGAFRTMQPIGVQKESSKNCCRTKVTTIYCIYIQSRRKMFKDMFCWRYPTKVLLALFHGAILITTPVKTLMRNPKLQSDDFQKILENFPSLSKKFNPWFGTQTSNLVEDTLIFGKKKKNILKGQSHEILEGCK